MIICNENECDKLSSNSSQSYLQDTNPPFLTLDISNIEGQTGLFNSG